MVLLGLDRWRLDVDRSAEERRVRLDTVEDFRDLDAVRERERERREERCWRYFSELRDVVVDEVVDFLG